VPEEDTEVADTIATLATPDDLAIQCDGYSPVLLVKGKETRAVENRIVAAQVANTESIDPDRDGVGVVRIGGFLEQDGDDVQAHMLCRGAADEGPESLLVVRLTDDLKGLVAVTKGHLDGLRGRARSAGRG